jgi:hypothetical protein
MVIAAPETQKRPISSPIQTPASPRPWQICLNLRNFRRNQIDISPPSFPQKRKSGKFLSAFTLTEPAG